MSVSVPRERVIESLPDGVTAEQQARRPPDVETIIGVVGPGSRSVESDDDIAQLRAVLREELDRLRRKRKAPAPLLTREEVADILGISVRHLDTVVSCGEICPIRIGRAVRFDPEAVERFIRERTGEGTDR